MVKIKRGTNNVGLGRRGLIGPRGSNRRLCHTGNGTSQTAFNNLFRVTLPVTSTQEERNLNKK